MRSGLHLQHFCLPMALAGFLIKLLLQGLYEKAVGIVSGIQLKIVKDQDARQCSYIFLAGPQWLTCSQTQQGKPNVIKVQ